MQPRLQVGVGWVLRGVCESFLHERPVTLCEHGVSVVLCLLHITNADTPPPTSLACDSVRLQYTANLTDCGLVIAKPTTTSS